MAEKKILCMPCYKALGSVNHQAQSIFLKLKDRGSLFKPTQSVITICEETEKCFERMMKVSGGNLPHCSNISEAIVTAVLSGINKTNKSRVFTEFGSHMFDTPIGENYVFSLIKTVSKCYCKVKFYHLGKEATTKVYEKNVRKTLTKLVLFNHQ